MRSWRNHGRSRGAAILTAFLVSALVGLTACDPGGENPPARPSASERSKDQPSGAADATRSREADRNEPTKTKPTNTEPSKTEPTKTKPTKTEPTKTEPTKAEPIKTEPTKTEATKAEPTRTTAAVETPGEPTRTATPAETTPTPAASPSAVAVAESQPLGPLGWLLLIALLAAMIIGGLLVYRSQRRSTWDAEARALESETRAVTATRLAPVLSTTTTGRRGLAWPPLRAALVDLVAGWNGLTERASGEERRNWSLRISGLLQELTAAVEAENEALAIGNDPLLLRPRVNQAEQALAAALAVQPQPDPPAAGQPGPPAFRP